MMEYLKKTLEQQNRGAKGRVLKEVGQNIKYSENGSILKFSHFFWDTRYKLL